MPVNGSHRPCIQSGSSKDNVEKGSFALPGFSISCETGETEAQICEVTCPSLCVTETTSLRLPHLRTPALCYLPATGESRGGHRTHLLDEVHEAAAEAPGLVPMALQGVHGHLRCSLVAHGHDVDSIVEQGSVGLQRAQACLRAEAAAPRLLPHLPPPTTSSQCPGREQVHRPRGSPVLSPQWPMWYLSGPMSLQ